MAKPDISGVMSVSDSAIPLKKLIKALLAISLGTVIEWVRLSYDFTIYTQLSKTLSKVFFPSNNAALQALSFWGVFFVGYISRPAGAVLFGHLGDTRGRGTCLLISVLVMGIPTVLIGCLPTYHQIGMAAPILLAVLRLVQGLAMGGEFGAAMVYLHEIADARYKAVTGSLGYVSLGVGVVIGILVVVMVISLIPGEALLVWGWRVPFLMSVATLAVAIVMRYNMPESAEFAASREEIEEEYKQRLQQKVKAGSGSNSPARSNSTEGEEQAISIDGRVSIADVESQGLEKHYVPLVELFRGYWSGLILQCGYEAWIGGSFYLGYSWLPSFFVAHAGISTMTSLWMVLTSMVLFTFVVPVAGYLSDKGQPRVTATIAICAIAAAMTVPMFLAFKTGSLAACWLLQAFGLAMTAYTMGILPAICSLIYPAGVRISGFNLGYNLGMTIFGGLTPLAMTAIQTGTGSIFIGPALWMVGMALISIVSSLLLIKCYPLTNQRGSF
uniref:Major facilitator superfamily (MFS) profile domain-containing protein n=1 Tax=Tetradesmus obliquus TaxID=3088 RepID=A0A383VDF7_TETOB|eukprot:jgi/Sobl393_1/18564/SZX62983.1